MFLVSYHQAKEKLNQMAQYEGYNEYLRANYVVKEQPNQVSKSSEMIKILKIFVTFSFKGLNYSSTSKRKFNSTFTFFRINIIF